MCSTDPSRRLTSLLIDCLLFILDGSLAWEFPEDNDCTVTMILFLIYVCFMIYIFELCFLRTNNNNNINNNNNYQQTTVKPSRHYRPSWNITV